MDTKQQDQLVWQFENALIQRELEGLTGPLHQEGLELLVAPLARKYRRLIRGGNPAELVEWLEETPSANIIK